MLSDLLRSARQEQNPFLFVPNLIGYARIILAILACYTMPHYPTATLIFYFFSAFLDAFDGLAARALDQSTKFGSLLDQLTDRCGTLCLIFVLGLFYPTYLFWFQMSVAIDIASHWIHTQVTLMSGKTSHKSIDLNENPILRLYYTNRPILFSMCFANEVFYVSLYMLYFYEGPLVLGSVGLFRLLTYICGPLAVAKATISLIQLIAACINVKELDLAERRSAVAGKSN
ncbi:hypothetical protein RDWZM_001783 [Blomia tropicalis]|uniref:CDP-diacylglycerol--inositol 3-phosphatidyltransferase n=1 Tax=Blomia tropicalis TaxID=40697 RepID=A0A9Q0RPA6_BLOTA|nr:hypothetical protein BLOT_008056 [Blomia tropicalis]KAJ6223238.1 hypothetical protein RDWZM_001783 [Blomia tropicalis]